jgi:hypothetical protein
MQERDSSTRTQNESYIFDALKAAENMLSEYSKTTYLLLQ